jgi:hypothetical protein
MILTLFSYSSGRIPKHIPILRDFLIIILQPRLQHRKALGRRLGCLLQRLPRPPLGQAGQERSISLPRHERNRAGAEPGGQLYRESAALYLGRRWTRRHNFNVAVKKHVCEHVGRGGVDQAGVRGQGRQANHGHVDKGIKYDSHFFWKSVQHSTFIIPLRIR